MTHRASTVSVVIATYNMAQYLGEAIQSVLNQTFGDLDVHVVDDGSTDETRDVVTTLSSDKRLKYYWQPNSGQTKAKNLGITSSCGEFVAFCDADDLWLPNKLEMQLPLFDAATVGVVYSRSQRILASGQHVQDEEGNPRFFSGSVTPELFKRNFIPFGTAVVRRSCLQEFGNFDERYRMGIDWDLWLKISTRYDIRFLDRHTYLYRVWPGQMSTNWRGRYESAFRIMESFLTRYPSLLRREVINEAYADCYAERARLRALRDGEYLNGIGDALRAIYIKPLYLPAWKVLGRILITAAGWPPPPYQTAPMSPFRKMVRGAVSPLARAMTKDEPRILMYHRFGIRGQFRRMPVDAFEEQIIYLRRHYEVVSLAELVKVLRPGDRPLRGLVALTIDDGYRDFLDYAYPILLKYRVPVTLYVVSAFIDQKIWLWFDAIHYLTRTASCNSYSMRICGRTLRGKLESEHDRDVLWEELADVCITLAPSPRDAAIHSIGRQLGVSLPSTPTPDYAAMTWEEIRALDPELVHVGVQTVSHPILSLCTVDEQRQEIMTSRLRIEAMLGRPALDFCYPNGQPGDFSDETVAILRDNNFSSAVVAGGGLIGANPDILRLARIGAPVERRDFCARVDGVGELRSRLLLRERRRTHV